VTIKKHSEAATALVCAANTVDMTMMGGLYVHDVDVATEFGHMIWTAKKYIAPILKGPASMAIHAYVATAAPQAFWHMIWAEFDTSELFTS